MLARRLAPLALAALIPLGLTSGTARAQSETITVFAAASLKNALDEIATRYEDETGTEVRVSYAGSSALARQIEQGAPADVFVSASIDWMDTLEAAGLIDVESRFALLRNAIVLVAHGEDTAPVAIEPGFDLAGLLGDERLAMALVTSVPAGIYGRAALETLGVWAEVEPKVAQADNVRAALALVATGEAPYGIVYETDAVAEPRVSVVGRFPTDSHPPIVYPAARIADSESAAVGPFLEYLTGPAAREAFERQGFVPIAE